jgi:hypothetical protein
MRDFFEGQGKAIIIGIGLASVALVGVLDYLTGSHVTLTAIYLLPVYFVAWHAGAGAGLLLALICAAAWLAAGMYAGRMFPSTLIMLWQVFRWPLLRACLRFCWPVCAKPSPGPGPCRWLIS